MVNGVPQLGPPKSIRSRRTIPIPEQFCPYVRYLREHSGTPYVWTCSGGNPLYGVGSFRRRFYTALKNVGQVRKLSPHCCRHTYVTMLQANGVPMETIAALTGHSDIKTTEGYLHQSADTLAKAVEVLYREEYAEPVLVFVDPEEPDKEVNLVTNDGVAAIWYPQEDGYGNLILPTDETGAPMLYDFAIYGYTTGLDYPEGWEPSGDDWWWPPTELGLADTSWLCDSWVLELRGGDAGPEYAGTADLYYAPAGYIKQDYLGVWRMEDDCLYLKLSADSGDEIDASFPILISPSGEDLYFQRSRTGAGIPFLSDGTDSVGLLLYTG